MPSVLDTATGPALNVQLLADFEPFLAAGGGLLPEHLHRGIVGGLLELPYQWFQYGGHGGAIYVARRQGT